MHAACLSWHHSVCRGCKHSIDTSYKCAVDTRSRSSQCKPADLSKDGEDLLDLGRMQQAGMSMHGYHHDCVQVGVYTEGNVAAWCNHVCGSSHSK